MLNAYQSITEFVLANYVWIILTWAGGCAVVMAFVIGDGIDETEDLG